MKQYYFVIIGIIVALLVYAYLHYVENKKDNPEPIDYTKPIIAGISAAGIYYLYDKYQGGNKNEMVPSKVVAPKKYFNMQHLIDEPDMDFMINLADF